MAFLLAAAAAGEVQQAQAAAAAGGAEGGADAAAGALSLARSYLQQARSAAALLQGRQAAEGEQGTGADPKSDVYLLLLVHGGGLACWAGRAAGASLALAMQSWVLLCHRRCPSPSVVPPLHLHLPLPSQDFKLCCLAGDVGAQVETLERCKALPAFGAEHFAMAAGLARGAAGPEPRGRGGRGADVVLAAEAARLHRLTQQAVLDYPAVAAVSMGAWGCAGTGVPVLRLCCAAALPPASGGAHLSGLPLPGPSGAAHAAGAEPQRRRPPAAAGRGGGAAVGGAARRVSGAGRRGGCLAEWGALPPYGPDLCPAAAARLPPGAALAGDHCVEPRRDARAFRARHGGGAVPGLGGGRAALRCAAGGAVPGVGVAAGIGQAAVVGGLESRHTWAALGTAVRGVFLVEFVLA